MCLLVLDVRFHKVRVATVKIIGEIENVLNKIGVTSDTIARAQFNQIISELNIMEEKPAQFSAPASGYSKKIKETIEGVLRVFSIAPSSNLYYDILVLLKEFSSRQMDQFLLESFLKYFFQQYDANKDGGISSQELKALLLDMNVILPETDQLTENMLEDASQGFLQAIDTNKNGVVEFDEFKSFFFNTIGKK